MQHCWEAACDALVRRTMRTPIPSLFGSTGSAACKGAMTASAQAAAGDMQQESLTRLHHTSLSVAMPQFDRPAASIKHKTHGQRQSAAQTSSQWQAGIVPNAKR